MARRVHSGPPRLRGTGFSEHNYSRLEVCTPRLRCYWVNLGVERLAGPFLFFFLAPLLHPVKPSTKAIWLEWKQLSCHNCSIWSRLQRGEV
ncbi:hypothetical protein CPSG_00666 [Coccidioides posadasii str. Silveira]|uniref:Uncharacterized protein n=1 Tax=Coccidioides posadasii (strain RMSCC 757 / Silveira) TaxID=443226 RepID=E9CSV7_COCPS|nr:hypothetical protein CPSG_00666 [Coccidioides posadasii str. Silveira]